MIYPPLKNILDRVIALILLILTAPLQVVTALLVATKLGRPVLFKQTRPGLRGAPFTMIKFRSMLSEDPAAGLVDDAQRITPFGQRLRSTSVDELPALWNVLRGDMSLVGPRPLLMEYLEYYTPEQARRHEVKPGITGLAQAKGRNSLTWEERFQLDVEYVDSMSLLLDVKVILWTLRSVFNRDGITQDGHVTMTKFGPDQ